MDSVSKLQEKLAAVKQEIAKVIVGQEQVVSEVLAAVISGGHVLLEGLPGLGKTVLVRTLGQVFAMEFSRIQFTPDLMPADITGTNIVSQRGDTRLVFQEGPLFANIVLADEINRATPKTQSALLEAMQERTVTVGRQTYELPQPFFVLATQNPIELEGTYPLPEAQLDRFMFKVKVDFPKEEELGNILDRVVTSRPASASKVAAQNDLLEMSSLIRDIPISSDVKDYAVKVILLAHPERDGSPARVQSYVRYGPSPRGLLNLVLAAKAAAFMDGRYNVAFADINQMAFPVLRHRIILNFEGQVENLSTDDVISDILKEAGGASGAHG